MTTLGTATILRAATRQRQAIALTAGHAGTIVAANLAIQHLPVAHIGPWLAIPAGAWFAGIAFALRNFLNMHGRRWVWAAIGIGTALSWLLAGPGLAIPSAASFLVAELADWLVWSSIQRRHPYWAMGLAIGIGAAVDTGIFLGLAVGVFHVAALAHVPVLALAGGQLVGKLATTIPALIVLRAIRRQPAGGAAALATSGYRREADVRAEVAEEIAVLIENACPEESPGNHAAGQFCEYEYAAAVARLCRVPDCGHELHGADGGPCPRCGFDIATTTRPGGVA